MSDLITRMREALPNGASVMCDWFAQSAENATITAADGRKIIDFAGGIGVLNTGHRHPKVTAAVAAQLEKFTHTAFQVVPYESYVLLAERINKLVPIGGKVKSQFFSSGAEAVENAIKIARHHTGRAGVIAFSGGFHGRTLFTVSVGGQPKYSQDFAPLPPAITHVPYNDAAALEAAVGPQTCAVMIEPVQGESGVLPAQKAFLEAARSACDAHQALLIFDEVQTGMGRTGKLFAYEHYGVAPDILTSAKALGCGFPIGAMLCTDKTATSFGPGTHGSTFGGNPLACAVGNAAFDIINRTDTLAHAAAQGAKLQAALHALGEERGVFKNVRGMGMLIGCVLADEYAGRAGELMQAALKHGLMILVAGADVVRLAPGLLLSDEDLNEGIERLGAAAAEWQQSAV